MKHVSSVRSKKKKEPRGFFLPDTHNCFIPTWLRQSGRLCQALRGRISELEAELAEQSHLKQQALGESEFLKAELDDLRRVKEDTEKEQRSLTEIESKTALPKIF